MKKILVLVMSLLVGSSAFAADYLSDNLLPETVHKKRVEKVMAVGHKIMYDNNLKRVPLSVSRTPKVINANSNPYNKSVVISDGLFSYLDSDDELAFVVAHEISHSIEAYGGFIKINAMSYNSKKYEYKADLNGIDYMVKSGYDPIAAIIIMNKIMDEPMWDWGFTSSHPKTSKRMLAAYKYIYVKYPKCLNSPMTKNIIYKNFLNSEASEIRKIEQRAKTRTDVQEAI